MKKGLIWILCVLLAVSVAGFAEEAAEMPYVMMIEETELAIDADMAAVVEALGEPDNYYESESCAYQGLDKVFMYGGIVIYTYPDGDMDRILAIYLMDDLSETPEGIWLGCLEEEVLEVYGEPTERTETGLLYTIGGTTLSFILAEDVVDAITYTQAVPVL